LIGQVNAMNSNGRLCSGEALDAVRGRSTGKDEVLIREFVDESTSYA